MMGCDELLLKIFQKCQRLIFSVLLPQIMTRFHSVNVLYFLIFYEIPRRLVCPFFLLS